MFNVECRDLPQAQEDYEDRSNQFLGFDILGYQRPILLVASLVTGKGTLKYRDIFHHKTT